MKTVWQPKHPLEESRVHPNGTKVKSPRTHMLCAIELRQPNFMSGMMLLRKEKGITISAEQT
jgi:hypothetical protein